MSYIFDKINKGSNVHAEALQQVSKWSAEFDNMRSYRPEELEEHPLGILAFAEDTKELLGHVAITEVSHIKEQKFARIGALVVSEASQNNGVATALISNLLNSAPDVVPDTSGYYAFVHALSLKPFLANGAQVVGTRQPSTPTGCDIIVSIKPEG